MEGPALVASKRAAIAAAIPGRQHQPEPSRRLLLPRIVLVVCVEQEQKVISELVGDLQSHRPADNAQVAAVDGWVTSEHDKLFNYFERSSRMACLTLYRP